MAAATIENNVPTMNGDNGSQGFSLRVANLPLEIEKEGAESLFLEYGEVTGLKLFRTGNTKQGYVSYGKYSEAEKAINDLNGKPPLYLNVEFKDKHLQNQQIRTEIDMSKPIDDFRYKPSSIQCAKVNMRKANCTPYMQPPNYTVDDELLYEVPTDPAIFNPYSNCGPYRETNLMYTRGPAYVSKDGRRHVAHGRGYTFYNLPEPRYEIETYIQKELEKRESEFYEYATEDLEDEVANCKICQTPTPLRCQKCTTAFYCSKPCQLSDWSKHKIECQPLPPLVKKINKIPQQNGHGVSPVQTVSEIVLPSQSAQQLRRPRTQPPRSETIQLSSALSKEQRSSITPEKKVQRTSPASSMRNGAIPRHSDEARSDLFKLSTPANFKADSTSFPSNKQQQQKQPSNATHKAPVSNEENIVFQLRTFIPKDKFIHVVVASPIAEGEYWVQRVEDEQALTDLLCDLRKYATQTKPVPPEENVKCIVKADDFFRATILSFTNNLAKVLYYDFGTVEDIEVKEVWPINGFVNIPPFARIIRMVDETDCKLKALEAGESLFVKAVSVTQDGTINVQAQLVSSSNEKLSTTPAETVKTPVEKVEQQIKSCSLKTETSKPLSPSELAAESEKLAYERLTNYLNIIDSVHIGQNGLIMMSAELDGNEYSATLVPNSAMDDFSKLFDLLKNKSLEYKSPYNPQVGDLVSGEQTPDESWFRGIVVSNTPVVRIALLDESRVISPLRCVPLPKEFEQISAMGLVVKYPEGCKVPEADGYQFTITGLSNGSATLSIKLDSYETTAIIKKWKPRPEQKGLLVPQLHSGQQVCVTDFFSQNSIHVQSVEPSEKERAFKLQQEVSKYSLNKKPFTEIPVVGTIVLAKFPADGSYYRAIVTKIEGQVALIKYIDYGNEEKVEKDKLFVLPDILKEHPTCAAEVSLKNVDKNVPLTEAATMYMQEVITAGVPLICTFDGNPLENGVILKSSTTNEIINDKMNNLLKPTWEQDQIEETKVFDITDLPSIKLGDVGDSIKAVYLCYYPENGSIFMGPNDLDAATAIQVQLAEQIAKYVEVTPDHYIPRDNELCIANYQGDFYRGMCLKSSATPTESRVLFVDYCNTELVKHQDIRIFPKDFLEIGAFGTLCSISPIVPSDKLNSKISERINEMLVSNEIYEIKIISVDNEGIFNIDIPRIRIALMEEKLI